jgi:hypothetical protein
MILSDDDRRTLEQSYAASYITGDMLRQQYGHEITSPGNLRGEDEHTHFIAKGLALRLPGQPRYRSK